MNSFALINEFLGQPPNASEHGFQIDHILEFAHWFMGALFVLGSGLLHRTRYGQHLYAMGGSREYNVVRNSSMSSGNGYLKYRYSPLPNPWRAMII